MIQDCIKDNGVAGRGGQGSGWCNHLGGRVQGLIKWIAIENFKSKHVNLALKNFKL
jgi:hypothetical protein